MIYTTSKAYKMRCLQSLSTLSKPISRFYQFSKGIVAKGCLDFAMSNNTDLPDLKPSLEHQNATTLGILHQGLGNRNFYSFLSPILGYTS